MGRLRRALSNISQQDSNSSLAVTSHAPLPRGEALAAENPVPQRDGKNHQSWMGTGQTPGSHYSHTWPALALATPSSHHPEERTFPNLTSLSHIPGTCLSPCATGGPVKARGCESPLAPHLSNFCPLGLWAFHLHLPSPPAYPMLIGTTLSKDPPDILCSGKSLKTPSCWRLTWPRPTSQCPALLRRAPKTQCMS